MFADIIIAGFGGQGILLIAELLAQAAMQEGRRVTWLPSYGVEMRGGTASCTVTVADEEIGSPYTRNPVNVAVMNEPSLIKYEPMLRTAGQLVLNSSLIDPARAEREDVKRCAVPANEIATGLGNVQMANMVMLGAICSRTGMAALESIEAILPRVFPERLHTKIPANIEALHAGRSIAEKGLTALEGEAS